MARVERFAARLAPGGATDNWLPRTPRPVSALLEAGFEPIVGLMFCAAVAAWATAQSLVWVGQTFPGFLLMGNAVVPTVSAYGWPEDKAALFHAQVAEIDGAPVRDSGDVYRRVGAGSPGTEHAYVFHKRGAPFRKIVTSRRFGLSDWTEVYGVLLIIAWMNVVTGAALAVMQPRRRQARVYVRLTFFGALLASTSVFLHQAGFPWLARLYLAAESFFPASFIHLALVFPIERHLVGWRRTWPLSAYALAAVLTAAKIHGYEADPPDVAALRLGYVFIAASFAFFVGSLFFAYRENRDPKVRPRIQALLPSVAAGGVLAAFAFIDSAFSAAFPLQWGLLFVPFFYASVAYAIAKHDLFEVDRMVRQSFVYAVLTVAVVSAYAVTVALPPRLFGWTDPGRRTSLGIGFVLVLAYLLEPLRRALQHLIDRAFYRSRLDYRTMIGELSQALLTLLSVPAILDRVMRVVTDAMHLEFTEVFLCERDGQSGTVWRRAGSGELRRMPAPNRLGELSQALRAARSPADADTACESIADPTAREAARAWVEESRARLLVLLELRERPLGLLILGGKRSGKPFDSEDIELLRTLGNQTAVALQNSLSYQALEELSRGLDATVHQRTAELRQAYEQLQEAQSQLVHSEKMASLGRLVAGVAHELNNPASFVHGGLANLAVYLERLIALVRAYGQPRSGAEQGRDVERLRDELKIDYLMRETPELIRICTEGSERIKKIVDDLRVFARAERGERVPTDVVAGIESTLRLLSDRTEGSAIRIEKRYAPVPTIEAQPALLNQVWTNLLANAIDALHSSALRDLTISVRTLCENNGGDASPGEDPAWVEVSIADTGCGIAAEDLGRVFEPFFTTKPIGRGTGLGLSTAYSAVKSHGGSIAVESGAGTGTKVTVRLPVRAAWD